MEQPELGKDEEQNLDSSSDAELSDLETAAADATDVENAGDAPTEIDEAQDEVEEPVEEPVADVESVDDDGDEENTTVDEDTDDTDDDEDDDDGPDEAGGLRRGEVIVGKVARTTPNEIFVDLGEDREGIVPKSEVELMSVKMLEQMKEGEDIPVFVVNPNNHKGNTILSINRAQEEMDWRSAEEYLESKQVYDGKIGGYNKGGLIVRFGRLRGFVPQSQISDKRHLDIEGNTPEERYSGMVNKQISVKVMEVDRSRNRLILSERAAMRVVRQRRKEALITELEVGEIREGRVVSLENFGAFVDVGGAEGLVHITELSYKHITHPRQVLKVGQEVEVKIINIDEDRNRIGLSLKQLQPDPWDELATRYNNGSIVRGIVTKLTKFGAFAKVVGLEEVEGLIHISELSDDRVEHPKDVVKKGDKLTLRIVKIDVKRRRLGLSLRRVNSAEYLDMDLKRAYIDQEERVADAEFEAEVEAETNAEVSEVEDAGTAAEPEVVADETPPTDAGEDTNVNEESEPETDADEAPAAEVESEPEVDDADETPVSENGAQPEASDEENTDAATDEAPAEEPES